MTLATSTSFPLRRNNKKSERCAASYLPRPGRHANMVERALRPETNIAGEDSMCFQLDAEACHYYWCRAGTDCRARGAVHDRRRRRESRVRQRQTGRVAAGQGQRLDRRSGEPARAKNRRQPAAEKFGRRAAGQSRHRSDRVARDRRRLDGCHQRRRCVEARSRQQDLRHRSEGQPPSSSIPSRDRSSRPVSRSVRPAISRWSPIAPANPFPSCRSTART